MALRSKIMMALLVLATAHFPMRAAEELKPVLKPGQRVAVVGDSITEQKQYSKFIELYLTACTPQLKLHLLQFGWGGETASGFKNRMENDLIPYKPDVVTFCYGMNDGGYRKFDENIGNNYKTNMAAIVKRLKELGATLVIGGPGAVDSKYFKGGAEVYNDNLAHLDAIAKTLAEENGFNHADVHSDMMEAQVAAKKAFGEDYDVCGRDGVHPNANGHLVMAYAYLKAMGLDGNIGTITIDMKGGAEASEGHKVLSAANGKAELESSRAPFCFSGDEKSSNGTRSILAYVPFNRDLNRFMLVVKKLDGEKAKVDWGGQTQEFSKADLEKGINLAEKFAAGNPFSAYMGKLEQAIANKENYETMMIKQSINPFMNISRALENDPEVTTALEMLKKKFFAKYEKLHEGVQALVAPVKHTITVTVEK